MKQDTAYDFDTNLTHLNDMQREAVKAADGPLLLLAGAGSGKTTVLISRIASLIVNKGVDPYNIIAITFTNKAAGEMKDRLGRMEIPGAANVWASTFHSACARILRAHIDKIGYESNFTIYDTADTAALMKRILKDEGLDEKTFPHKTVLAYISRAKDEMILASDFTQAAKRDGDPRRKMIGYAYEEYEKRLKSSNALDFDDLILLTVRLLRERPDVLRHYQNRFRYVLVDEYQDTNNLQYCLTEAFAGMHGNICVVGDDDQSIYKFRGATIENILSFEKRFKNARIIRLEQNYRSTAAILNAANDVIRNNRGRKGKTLWTKNDAGDKPILKIIADERAEAEFVADEIIKSVSGGRKFGEHVILYRMNAQSNQFETAFKRAGIPYRVYGGTGFYERAEIKDMLAYLCVIHNPNDDVRLLRIINNPARGIGDTTVERLAAIGAELGISIFDAIYQAYRYENVKNAAAKLVKFADMIGELHKFSANNPLDELYDELLRQTGYIKMLQEKNTDESLSRIENVRELKTNIIAFLMDSGGGGSLGDFLNETALYTDLDRDDQSGDKVFMMTMHSAKGLEFDTVFIAGAEEGIFPGIRAIGDLPEMEEERRLCYVAMTRAMKRLYFTCARRRMIFGKTNASSTSRFVGEIAQGNVDVHDFDVYDTDTHGFYADADDIGSRHTYSHYGRYKPGMYHEQNQMQGAGRNEPRHTKRYAPRDVEQGAKMDFYAPKNTSKIAALSDYSEGDSVEHNVFGKGVIKKMTPAGNDALLEIVFDGHGTKQLLLKTAAQYMKKV
ncbi:MAG: UvrD-helicase domain-containing protein [Oscillospiraceae bacterium]|nr:UvrD-helicase domain-containing protein [Oscillospiraceae bacterium]